MVENIHWSYLWLFLSFPLSTPLPLFPTVFTGLVNPSHTVPVSLPLICLSTHWHMFIVFQAPFPDLLRCNEGLFNCFALISCCLSFTGDCWRSDAGGQTSLPSQHCMHHLWVTKYRPLTEGRVIG